VLYEYLKATLGIRKENKKSISREYARHDVSFDWIGELGASGASKLITAAIVYPHEAGLSILIIKSALLIHQT
jgi:hypothetical protein